MSVRLDRMQKALFDLFGGLGATVTWEYEQVPHEQLGETVISLAATAGPSPHNRQAHAGVLLLPADSVVVRITGATVGTRNVIKLNGFDYYRDTIAGDTFTTIRDAMMSNIEAGEDGAVSVAADGADGIAMTADFLGGLRRLQLVGELSADAPVFSGSGVLEQEHTILYLVGVQTYSKRRELRHGANSLADLALDETRAHDKLELLERAGVAIWERSDVTDLTAIAGANWETRAAFDLTIAARTIAVREIDLIETVEIDGDVDLVGERIDDGTVIAVHLAHPAHREHRPLPGPDSFALFLGDRTDPDLDRGADLPHPAHHRGVGERGALELGAQITVRVDLEHGE